MTNCDQLLPPQVHLMAFILLFKGSSLKQGIWVFYTIPVQLDICMKDNLFKSWTTMFNMWTKINHKDPKRHCDSQTEHHSPLA